MNRYTYKTRAQTLWQWFSVIPTPLCFQLTILIISQTSEIWWIKVSLLQNSVLFITQRRNTTSVLIAAWYSKMQKPLHFAVSYHLWSLVPASNKIIFCVYMNNLSIASFTAFTHVFFSHFSALHFLHSFLVLPSPLHTPFFSALQQRNSWVNSSLEFRIAIVSAKSYF